MFAMTFKCFASVSDVCCKCFSYFRTYVASISSGCSKSRYDIAHVIMDPLVQPPAAAAG
jgi:hypothetical protein